MLPFRNNTIFALLCSPPETSSWFFTPYVGAEVMRIFNKRKSDLFFFSRLFFCLWLLVCAAGAVRAQVLPPEKKETPELPAGLLDAVVAIKTDLGSGTGFIAKFRERFYIFTNQHVIDGVKSIELRTRTGLSLRPASFVGAYDADLALLMLPEYQETSPYFTIAPNTTFSVKGNDEVLIPGNSLGDGVITSTPGKVLNVGPQRIEVDNPVFPGNSGSPIYHLASGSVIGVLTEAHVRDSKSLDRVSKSSTESKNSQVKSETRYFGHRIDSVAQWGAFDWNSYQNLSNYLSNAETEMTCIENFLSGSDLPYQDFEELHQSVNDADAILASDKFAEVEYTKALESLISDIKSLTVRRVRNYESSPQNFSKPLYRQNVLLDELKSRADAVARENDIRGRNIDLWKKLLQRDQ